MSIVSAESGDVPSSEPGLDDAGPDQTLTSPTATSPPVNQPTTIQPATWQQAMQRAIRRSDELLEAVGLEANECDMPSFPVFVPREFVARIRPGDVHDPLLRQVLATSAEATQNDVFTLDPVGDQEAQAENGLLQKYEGRALWVLTGVCPVHCRYCFRQHFDYQRQSASNRQVAGGFAEPGLAWLRSHTDVEEIILSGGDPLSLDDEKLAGLVQRLDSIPHLSRLRFHTRMPVMIPQRVTPPLVRLLRDSRLAAYFVVHINHAAEIDRAVELAIARLVDAGIPVLNQSVLLAGVNDDVEALVNLSKRLIDLRVLPYYLHQLDRVQGAAHFEVSTQRGKALIDAMRRRLPGYAVPRYVQEIPGAPSKTPIL